MGIFPRIPLKGKYFIYCQWCKRDGHCILRHHQFLGAKTSGQIDKSPYQGHDDMIWHSTAFQQNTKRATCNGRICETGSPFYPLTCKCGTAISSYTSYSILFGEFHCAKFQPNKKGKERLKIAQEIAKKRKIGLLEIESKDLPEIDPNYEATMTF